MYKVVKRFADLLADSIVGLDGTKVFVGRTSLEFPDYDSLEKVMVEKNKPHMAIIANTKYSPAFQLADKKDVCTISAIVHTGVSAASYSLSGQHRGNNSFVLEITQSGPPGSAIYKLSKDNGNIFGAPLTVPGNGQVNIDDGTILSFGVEGNLATGDRYSWQTISMKELIYQTDTFISGLSINIHCADEAEYFGNDDFSGFIDQIVIFFQQNRAIHDNEYIYNISLDRGAHPQSGIRKGLFYGVITAIIEGAMYYKNQIPLIGETLVEV
jgi:hypothetical protein